MAQSSRDAPSAEATLTLAKDGRNISSADATPAPAEDDGDMSWEDTMVTSAKDDTTHTLAKEDTTLTRAGDDTALTLAKDDRLPDSHNVQEPANEGLHVSPNPMSHDQGEASTSHNDARIPPLDTILTPQNEVISEPQQSPTLDDETPGDRQDDQTFCTQNTSPAKDNVPPDCVEMEQSPQRSSISEKILITCHNTHRNHIGIVSSSDADSVPEDMSLDTSEEQGIHWEEAALSDASQDVLDICALETDNEAGKHENMTEEEAILQSHETQPIIGRLSIASNN
jgi:hypothetical protein